MSSRLRPITFGIATASLLFGFAPASQTTLQEIRMCSSSELITVCPTDTPVFDNGTERVYVSVSASDVQVGQEIRFSWYRIDDENFFDSYLATAYERAEGPTVVSAFPSDVALSPGRYEVVIHPPDDARPIIKNFKVLD